MNRSLKQVRWIGTSAGGRDPLTSTGINNISDMTHNLLNDGETAVQIGIQAPTGTRFWINETHYILVMGRTGIFEWSVEDTGTYITSFGFYDNGNTITLDPKEKYIVDFYLEDTTVTSTGG